MNAFWHCIGAIYFLVDTLDTSFYVWVLETERETGKDKIQVHLSRFLHDVYVCYEHSVLLLGDGLFVCEGLDLDLVGGIQKKNGWMAGVKIACNAMAVEFS
jgi:hypothetical protein